MPRGRPKVTGRSVVQRCCHLQPMKEAVDWRAAHNNVLLCYYYWLCWVSTAVRAFPQLRRAGAPNWDAPASHCSGFSCCGARASASCLTRAQESWPQVLENGSAAVGHRLSCSTACGIFPDQGLNPCLLHWQADSLPRSHQGSPSNVILNWHRFGILTA